MNDTILLNERQKKILYLLREKGKLSRLELTKLVSQRKTYSKITLIRDLNNLLKADLISSVGKGRAIKYFLPNINPLLSYIDIEAYFEKNPEERSVKKEFEKEIFTKLKNLFTNEEKSKWIEASKQYKRRVKKLDNSIFKRELERFIVEFAWKSAQIEGNTYDLLETETLLTQNIEAKGHSREEAIMLINHKKAFDMILANKKSFFKLDFSDVTQLHSTLIKKLVSSGIRNQEVRITGTSYIPPSNSADLENYLRKTIRLINTTDFPAQKAFIASFMIAYLLPFADGNKRTARMLSNTILLTHDYFPLSYRSVDVNEYKKAIIIFYEQNNLYHLKKIFSGQLDFALDNYFN
jgi:Fic family protein